MDDSKIVNLYWERSESAIKETQNKYGRYCHSIAYNILNSWEDAEECVNDAYIKTWNSIPPNRPNALSTYIGKIIRNLALNRLRDNSAQKRISSAACFSIEELEECIPDGETADAIDAVALGEIINCFLKKLPKKHRIIFMQRYWYFCPISDIADDTGLTESNVKVILLRAREKLKDFLSKEGIVI